jgi:hypothetical protein
MANPKKFTLHTVPKEAVVNVPISGSLFQRLCGAYFTYVSKFSSEDIELIFKAIAQKDYSSLKPKMQEDASAIHGLLVALSCIEMSFKEEKLIKAEEIEVPTED